MNWTENGEKKRLYEWVCENKDTVFFDKISDSLETYYHSFDNTNNVREYGFSSVPELENDLDELWRNEPLFDSIRRVCAVAAFKLRPEIVPENQEKGDNGEDNLKIPDYVYMF